MPHSDAAQPTTQDDKITASDDMGTRYGFTVTGEDAGARLDKYLTTTLAGKAKTPDAPLSRARIRQLLETGQVLLTAKPGAAPKPATDPAYKVREGEHIVVTVPAPRPAEPVGQEIPLDILYEDADLIVIVKPAGLVVHPAPGNPDMTLVNALIAHCGDQLSGIGGEKRPGIVHRLDKETSGVMVVAKSDRAHQGLAAQFAAHGRDGKLERAYTALVWGRPEPTSGTVDAPIARSTQNRRKMATVRSSAASGAREAITHYKTLKSWGEPPLVSLVTCHLETGRTHQIRVHMTSIGHPLLGDPVYGGSQKTRKVKLPPEAQQALESLDRQALHAHLLAFEHPASHEKMRFEAPIPNDIKSLIDSLELV